MYCQKWRRAGTEWRLQNAILFIAKSDDSYDTCGPYPCNLWRRSAHLYLRFFYVPLAAALFCLVVAISDGDTLTVRCGTPGNYHPVKVRIAAIDAPESRQAFGQKSRQNLAQLCFKKQATLQTVDTDSYGRTVANVRCGGTDAAAAQVRAGLAWVYTPYAHNHPHLAPLQGLARASGTGLWSQKRPLAPWDYRHRRARQNAR